MPALSSQILSLITAATLMIAAACTPRTTFIPDQTPFVNLISPTVTRTINAAPNLSPGQTQQPPSITSIVPTVPLATPIPTSSGKAILASGGILINHTCTDIHKIPARWIEQAKKLTIHLAHRSHGSQVLAGLAYWMRQDPRYAYAITMNGTPELSPDRGALRIYDGNNYKTGPNGRPPNYIIPEMYWWTPDGLRHTHSVLDTGLFNVDYWTWSADLIQGDRSYPQYVDTYLNVLQGLEEQYPNMRFIYSSPPMIEPDPPQWKIDLLAKNRARLDTFTQQNKKIYFDFYDLELTDPSGQKHPQSTEVCSWCQQWCSGHPDDCSDLPGTMSDCQHTHGLQCKLKGAAFWWLLARLIGWDGQSQ